MPKKSEEEQLPKVHILQSSFSTYSVYGAPTLCLIMFGAGVTGLMPNLREATIPLGKQRSKVSIRTECGTHPEQENPGREIRARITFQKSEGTEVTTNTGAPALPVCLGQNREVP